jgi:hypothetical protein
MGDLMFYYDLLVEPQVRLSRDLKNQVNKNILF